jgi:hypothetical protein
MKSSTRFFLNHPKLTMRVIKAMDFIAVRPALSTMIHKTGFTHAVKTLLVPAASILMMKEGQMKAQCLAKFGLKAVAL